VGADFDYIKKQEKQGDANGITTACNLLTAGFGIGDNGWLVPAERVLGVETADESDSLPIDVDEGILGKGEGRDVVSNRGGQGVGGTGSNRDRALLRPSPFSSLTPEWAPVAPEWAPEWEPEWETSGT
jgi:hypothetical protein